MHAMWSYRLQIGKFDLCHMVSSKIGALLTTGFANRKQLYLLYHYLNHYNLFGSSYYSQAEGILRELTNKI